LINGRVLVGTGLEDHTLNLIRRGVPPWESPKVVYYSPYKAGKPASHTVPGSQEFAVGGIPDPVVKKLKTTGEKVYCPQTHYWIVYEDLGMPLHNFSLTNILKSLPDLVNGTHT
jgi:hypothetical protein